MIQRMSGEKYASPARSKPAVSWVTSRRLSDSLTLRCDAHPISKLDNIADAIQNFFERLTVFIADMVKDIRTLAISVGG